MKNATLSIRHALAALAAVACSSAPLQARAQDADPMYRDARAACTAGRLTQSRADCLYEARSVLRDLRRGETFHVDEQTLAANRVARCDGVAADVRDGCLLLARGEGEREGSVAEGAIVMWLDEEPTVSDATAGATRQR